MNATVETHQQLHVLLPTSVMERLKQLATENGHTPARLARRWIEERLVSEQAQELAYCSPEELKARLETA